MILSFDLDGVIADTDNGLLNLLHRAERRDGVVKRDEAGHHYFGEEAGHHYLQQYYARRKIMMDPRELTGPGDEYHIVTGRVPSAHKITRVWVERWLGADSLPNLHLVSDSTIERFFEQGKTEAASVELGQRKLRVLQFIKAQVHFDNNPLIVAYLRSEGMTSVLVGGGLL